MLVKHLFECYAIITKKAVLTAKLEELLMYQRVRDIREDNDKRQDEIAEVLKITRQQYQLYESGKRELPMHHFVTLARYYNVSLDYLAGLIDTPEKLNRFGKK